MAKSADKGKWPSTEAEPLRKMVEHSRVKRPCKFAAENEILLPNHARLALFQTRNCQPDAAIGCRRIAGFGTKTAGRKVNHFDLMGTLPAFTQAGAENHLEPVFAAHILGKGAVYNS
jgi:hypothetical protein